MRGCPHAAHNCDRYVSLCGGGMVPWEDSVHNQCTHPMHVPNACTQPMHHKQQIPTHALHAHMLPSTVVLMHMFSHMHMFSLTLAGAPVMPTIPASSPAPLISREAVQHLEVCVLLCIVYYCVLCILCIVYAYCVLYMLTHNTHTCTTHTHTCTTHTHIHTRARTHTHIIGSVGCWCCYCCSSSFQHSTASTGRHQLGCVCVVWCCFCVL